ncbi:MAG: hypothetical protein IJN19_02485 [Opitutales bacterium]|nr:hypothetical protein [Opitutales bacterium]
MKTKKTPATKKVSKNRLLCVTLPETLLAATRVYRKKSGFSSMSELLRAAVDKAAAVAQKKGAQEKKTQISFRLSDELYTSLFRASNQSGQSIARIIRTLLESAPKLGIRPVGMPTPKKRAAAPAKTAKPAKKTAPAAKPATKKTPVSAKVAKPVKKVAAKKPVPAKKAVSAKKAASVKKPVPVKKAVPAKKSAVPKKIAAQKKSSAKRR